MYIKRSNGPHMVALPDGTHLSRADLPSEKTTRWVASRKAAVVRAVDAGLIDNEEACEMYGLSEEELDSWRAAVAEYGVGALKTTALQRFRQSDRKIDATSDAPNC
ncbi:DUF1153 domain-containing protein [Litoreibacter sp.]|nr:DUF1153 domain-containing protein [Litoreibacter sp.]